MYTFGKSSQSNLDSCHVDIQKILNEAIKIVDFSIIEGLREDARQVELFNDGKSQLNGVSSRSKHQDNGSGLSMAVDIMPYYKGFNSFTNESGPKFFYYLAGHIIAIADKLYRDGTISHKLRWGGNWDSDMDLFQDSNFFDLPHFELTSGL